MTRQRIVSSVLGGLFALALVALFVGSAFQTATLVDRAQSTAAYVAKVSHAPGYQYDVIAAGYHVCGQMGRGETFEDVVARADVDGIGGDLYPADAVVALTQAAREQLCPEVAA